MKSVFYLAVEKFYFSCMCVCVCVGVSENWTIECALMKCSWNELLCIAACLYREMWSRLEFLKSLKGEWIMLDCNCKKKKKNCNKSWGLITAFHSWYGEKNTRKQSKGRSVAPFAFSRQIVLLLSSTSLTCQPSSTITCSQINSPVLMSLGNMAHHGGGLLVTWSYQVTWRGSSTGVPQGSVLRPLLFSLYTSLSLS